MHGCLDPRDRERPSPRMDGNRYGSRSERSAVMKTMWMRILPVALCVAWADGTAADLVLRFEPAGAYLYLSFDSQTATDYQFQTSTNLSTWSDFEAVIPGDGSSKTQVVATAGQPMAYFRLQATQTSPGLAPSAAEYSELVVGQTILGYTYVDPTRFRWFGEWGDWNYTKTGSNTGKLVFTYDEDGNDPAFYREEIVLTFQTRTQGTFRYSEFNFGVEAPGSVWTGPFDLGGP